MSHKIILSVSISLKGYYKCPSDRKEKEDRVTRVLEKEMKISGNTQRPKEEGMEIAMYTFL